MSPEDPSVEQKPWIEFPNSRPKIVMEVGHGGRLTADFREIQDYLKKTESNYVGVDPNPQAHASLSSLTQSQHWVKSLQEKVQNIEEGNIADEVWVRNLRLDLARQDQDTAQLVEKIYSFLKPGGTAMIVDTYLRYQPEDKRKIDQTIASTTIPPESIQEIDLATDEHPFIARYRRMDEKVGRRDYSGAVGIRIIKAKI